MYECQAMIRIVPGGARNFREKGNGRRTMGLFDLFGGGKKKAAEEEAQNEQRRIEEHDKTVEDQKQAHNSLPWPTVARLNILQPKDSDAVKADDPLSAERKDEIGPLIYEPELKPDDVKDFTLQELLFLLSAQEIFNRRAALIDYEKNRRVLYNDFLRRIHESEKIYVLYDKRTRYPLIDGGFAVIYLDREHADRAVQLYAKQFRDLEVKEQPGEAAPAADNGQRQATTFDYLWFLGLQSIVVDNGWYKGFVKRDEIAVPPTFNVDPKKVPPAAPGLVFTMLDYLGERKWPVNYKNRDAILHKKEERMYNQIRRTLFLVPVQLTQAPEGVSNGILEGPLAGKEIRLALLKAKDKSGTGEKNLLPVYTDFIEYSKTAFAKGGLKPLGFRFANLGHFLDNVDAMIINSNGEGLVIPKAKALELQKADSVNAQTITTPAPQAAPSGEAPAAAANDSADALGTASQEDHAGHLDE